MSKNKFSGGNGNVQIGRGTMIMCGSGNIQAGGSIIINRQKVSGVEGINGCGIIDTEERPIGITSRSIRIKSEIAADIFVSCGASQSRVVITAEKNIIPLIQAEVLGECLTVKTTKNFNAFHSIRLNLDVPSLDSFTQNGSGDVSIKGVAGAIFSVSLLGQGDISVDGFANELQLVLNGVGDIEACGLKAKKADLSLKGVGDISAFATETVHATLSGVGDIIIRGNPRVSSSCSGVGEIRTE